MTEIVADRPPTPTETGQGASARDALHGARQATLMVLIGLALLSVVTPLLLPVGVLPPTPIMYRQDLALLPLFCMAALLLRDGARPPSARALRLPGWGLALGAAALFALCLWGAYGVFHGIDLSRDEQMASFDAAIFRSGRLAAPIPAEWRPVAPALNLLFLLPLGDHAAWVSSYLPVNAGVRALVGLVADPVVTSPLLVTGGWLALAAVARRLWPESPGSQFAAMLCYLGSSQIVVTGMTAFAMTLHLCLNLVWLWLFLRGGAAGTAGSLAVGFLATGAHQPLFHPLFALPFMLVLLRARAWGRLAAYGIGYALIAGFWWAWPVWMSGHAGPVPPANAGDGIDYGTRLMHLLAAIQPSAIWTMAANLIRFVTWQHLLLLPLMLLALAGWRRGPSLVAPLAIGLVLPILVMGLLLPWQGHGWGYRYLHPVLGNAILLAGYGWRRLERLKRDRPGALLATSAASVLVLLPIHAVLTSRMVAAQALPDRAIARRDADVAIVDSAPFAENLVINAPDLGNRPIRLIGREVAPADIAAICRGRRLAFVDAPQLNALSLYYDGQRALAPSDHQRALHAAARAAGCRLSSG